ncbi:MAG: demethoxyubiquinone hydroxylase family protein, partial [Sphingopyxis sp.]
MAPSARARAAMVRVDQAGEFGAKRIYQGQLAVLGQNGPGARAIAHMAQQEQRHLDWFNGAMARR